MKTIFALSILFSWIENEQSKSTSKEPHINLFRLINPNLQIKTYLSFLREIKRLIVKHGDYLDFFLLEKLCLFCMVWYGINSYPLKNLIFVGSLDSLRIKWQRLKRSSDMDRRRRTPRRQLKEGHKSGQ